MAGSTTTLCLFGVGSHTMLIVTGNLAETQQLSGFLALTLGKRISGTNYRRACVSSSRTSFTVWVVSNLNTDTNKWLFQYSWIKKVTSCLWVVYFFLVLFLRGFLCAWWRPQLQTSKKADGKKLWKTYQLSSFIDLRFGQMDLRFGQNDSTQRQLPFQSQKEMVSCRFGGEITLIWTQVPTWHPSTRLGTFGMNPQPCWHLVIQELSDDRRAVSPGKKHRISEGWGLRVWHEKKQMVF